MTWYVRLDGAVIGTVIAAHWAEVLAAARVKFPTWGIMEVELRKR